MFKTNIEPMIPLDQDANKELKRKLEVLHFKYVNGLCPEFAGIKKAIETNHELIMEEGETGKKNELITCARCRRLGEKHQGQDVEENGEMVWVCWMCVKAFRIKNPPVEKGVEGKE